MIEAFLGLCQHPGQSPGQIAGVAQKVGIRDLRQSALLKVRNGITSLAEINRITTN